MADWYLSEIRTFAFTFPPKGWAFCNGQTLAIQQNRRCSPCSGRPTAATGSPPSSCPTSRAVSPAHFGTQGGHTIALGEQTGEVNHTLLTTEMPAHNHLLQGTTTAADLPSPGANTMAAARHDLRDLARRPVALADASVLNAGGNQPHPNQQPYLVLNVCIALTGIFPSRN